MTNKMENSNKIIAYRVRTIRSQFADTRDRQERGRVEREVIETADLNEAKEAYHNTGTGMEVDKELVAVSMIGFSEHEEIIETTYPAE